MNEPGRTVLITGAAGALGLAVAHRLAAEAGTRLVLCDRDAAGLEVARSGLSGSEVETVVADVGDAGEVDAAVGFAVERFGGLDVMINNAGILSPNKRLHQLVPEEWEAQLRVNLMGAVHGMTAAIRVMRHGGGGSIINTASVAGLTAWTHSAPYCAAKAAVIHLSKVAAVEYARDRIRVNCVCPGTFESSMSQLIPEAALTGLTARYPLGLGTPAGLVGAFAYLAGAESGWTTGTAMVVDGGYTAP